jgi:hypothetical protein
MRITPITYSAAAILLGAGAALLPAISAQAVTLGTLTCQGTESIAYSPPLTPTPRATKISAETIFGPCVSTDPSISGGLAHVHAVSPSASCDELTKGTVRTTLTWSNGNTSTFSATRTTDDVNGEVVTTDTGVIVSGEFAGNDATEVVVLPDLDPASCETTGIASASGTATFKILPI